MTIGEKIKAQRRRLGYTQADVAGDYISRNMLSLIESGNATPSLETLRYLADTLHLPIEYLVSEKASLSPFLKLQLEGEILESFNQEKYKKVLFLIDKLGQFDDLLALLGAEAAYRYARKKLAEGSLESAKSYLLRVDEYLSKSKIDSPMLRAKVALASSIAQNISSPKLNFDEANYLSLIKKSTDEEFFHYYSMDLNYSYENEILSLHMQAKEQMRKRNYQAAILLLTQAEDIKTADNYEAFVFLGIYSDLETCYKELADFEKAYRYVTKRLSMMEYLKT